MTRVTSKKDVMLLHLHFKVWVLGLLGLPSCSSFSLLRLLVVYHLPRLFIFAKSEKYWRDYEIRESEQNGALLSSKGPSLTGTIRGHGPKLRAGAFCLAMV